MQTEEIATIASKPIPLAFIDIVEEVSSSEKPVCPILKESLIIADNDPYRRIVSINISKLRKEKAPMNALIIRNGSKR